MENLERAFEQLDNAIENLFSELKNLEGEHKSELLPVLKAINLFKPNETGDQKQFLNDLINLSEAVIEISYKKQLSLLYRKLTLPPYDLFLPFKSKSLSNSENNGSTPIPSNKVIILTKKIIEEKKELLKDNGDNNG